MRRKLHQWPSRWAASRSDALVLEAEALVKVTRAGVVFVNVEEQAGVRRVRERRCASVL